MNIEMAWWIIDQLVQQEVDHFCLAPGSRSTPLALAAAHHPKVKLHVHYDERGLGFYALGLARASGKAAAIIVTSGTAVGNLLPAVMEAYHSRAPLVLLTADRPPELIGAGANQVCDQVGLFSHFVRGHIHLPTADREVKETYVRSCMADAVCQAKEDPGPVHVNWFIREAPFVPPFPSLPEGKTIRLTASRRLPSEETHLFGSGVIQIGRLPKRDDLEPILNLAQKLRWPVLADILSEARWHMTDEQIQHVDLLLQNTPLEAETVLHFGERATSKAMLNYSPSARRIHVSPWKELQDPSRILTERVLAEPKEFCCSAKISPAPASWLAAWKEKEKSAKEIVAGHLEDKNLCTEPHGFHALSSCFDPSWSLYLGSGMPIRDADLFFFPPEQEMQGKIFSNRGLSGIDGNIATASGLALELEGPLVAWIGDQAALYDLNSLPLLKHTKHPVFLVISNNFGGGMFSHLPIAKTTEHFEKLWANSHSWHFAEAAKLFNLPYTKAKSIEELTAFFKQAPSQSTILEFITCRKTNFENHQEIKRRLSQFLFQLEKTYRNGDGRKRV